MTQPDQSGTSATGCYTRLYKNLGSTSPIVISDIVTCGTLLESTDASYLDQDHALITHRAWRLSGDRQTRNPQERVS